MVAANRVEGPRPIIYAMTIPNNAAHADWAIKFAQFLLSKAGQTMDWSKSSRQH